MGQEDKDSSSEDDRMSEPLLAGSASTAAALLATHIEASDEKPLSFAVRLSYGWAGTSTYVAATIIGFFLNVFFLEVANLSPFTAGTLILVGRAWDAISDPLIGYASDQTRTSMGRRRPWFFAAMLPYGITYFLLWMVPSTSQTMLTLYYMLMFLLFTTSSTSYAIPFNAMTPELTSSYRERTVLVGYSSLLSIVLGGVFSVVHSILIESFPDPQDPALRNYKLGYGVSAVVIGTAIALPLLPAFFLLKERPVTSAPSAASLSALVLQLLKTLRNLPLVCTMAMYSMAFCAINFLQGNILLYVKYVQKEESYFPYIMIIVQVTAAVSLPFWAWLSNRIGKKQSYAYGMMPFCIACLCLTFLPEHYPVSVCTLSFVAASGLAVASLVPSSMMPDAVDYDEWQTGERREGACYSVFVLFQKISLAVAIALSSYVLGLTGYISPDQLDDMQKEEDYQPHSVILALRIMLGIVPVVLTMVSYIAVWYYPITEESLRIIQGDLARRIAKEPRP